MAVNVRGPFLMAKYVVPHMRARRYGKIINTGSGTVFRGIPQMVHYVTSKGAVSAAFQYFTTPALSLELSAGRYLSDPFQGLPAAGYVSAGIRVHATPRRFTPPAALARRLAPLVASRRGDSVVVRFRMEGARSVAIAGDWNSWRPTALRALGSGGSGGDIWEGAFVLAPGTYHFNLFVDGKEWVVPGGVAVVPDGMGGLVAVLTVL